MDQLAYQLALLGNNASRDTAFPVIEVNNGTGRKNFNKATSGIPIDAIRIIESLQPYNRGDAYKSSKLWQLNALWNIDKHRRTPARFAGIQVGIRHPPEMPPVQSGTYYGGIMRFPLAAKPYIKVETSVQLSIKFGDEEKGVFVDVSELRDMHNFVRDEVMARFDQLFH